MRLSPQQFEDAAACGVRSASVIISVDKIIGLELELHDGRRMNVDAYNPPDPKQPEDGDADGSFRIYFCKTEKE